MHKEDYDSMKSLEKILEKDLQKEIAKINTAGTINPTEVENISEAVCLMLKIKEYEQWMDNEEGMSYNGNSYGQSRNSYNMSYGGNSYMMPNYNGNGYMMPNSMMMPQQQMSYGQYGNNTSNHSTKDRMVSRLEDMMGDAKNEYEAKMIRDAISYIQSN